MKEIIVLFWIVIYVLYFNIARYKLSADNTKQILARFFHTLHSGYYRNTLTYYDNKQPGIRTLCCVSCHIHTAIYEIYLLWNKHPKVVNDNNKLSLQRTKFVVANCRHICTRPYPIYMTIFQQMPVTATNCTPSVRNGWKLWLTARSLCFVNLEFSVW